MNGWSASSVSLLHLYAGEKTGFPLQKAFAELGISSRILELDLKRGEEHQMLGDSKVFRAIRSVLRHYRPGARGVIGSLWSNRTTS